MKKLYRFGATVLAVLAGLAAVGAGALIVATAAVLGGLIVVAAKLALKGAAQNAGSTPQPDALEGGQAVA